MTPSIGNIIQNIKTDIGISETKIIVNKKLFQNVT